MMMATKQQGYDEDGEDDDNNKDKSVTLLAGHYTT
jgi:hypothetical protein